MLPIIPNQKQKWKQRDDFYGLPPTVAWEKVIERVFQEVGVGCQPGQEVEARIRGKLNDGPVMI